MKAGGGGNGGLGRDDYVLPQNLDAELSVLGASMLTPNVIPGVSEIIRPHHFYRLAHQHVFEVIEDLFSRGEPVDPITVCEALANRALLEAVRARYRLPEPIRDAITSHHGTKLIRYFYSRAKEQQDPDRGEVQESEFRYPGPRPRTKSCGCTHPAARPENKS